MKALLRAHLRRRGHVQVTCLLEYQKKAARRSLHLKRRSCGRRLHFSQDEQAHLPKMSSSSAPDCKDTAQLIFFIFEVLTKFLGFTKNLMAC